MILSSQDSFYFRPNVSIHVMRRGRYRFRRWLTGSRLILPARISLVTALSVSMLFVIAGTLPLRTCFAQLPTPKLQAISPSMVEVGSQVEIKLIGSDLDEASKLVFNHPGFTAQAILDDNEFLADLPLGARFKLNVDSQVPEGDYFVRAIGRFGVSNPKRIRVVHDSVEGIKVDHSAPESATVSERGVWYQDHLRAAQKHWYQFQNDDDGFATLQIHSDLADTRSQIVATILNRAQQEIGSYTIEYGAHQIVSFAAEPNETYFVSVNDLLFQGSERHVYQINLDSNRPQIHHVWPTVIAPSAKQPLYLYGWHLDDSNAQEIKLENLPGIQAIQVNPASQQLSLTEKAFSRNHYAYRFLQNDRLGLHRLRFRVSPDSTQAASMNEVELLKTSLPLVLETNESDLSLNHELDHDSFQTVSVPSLLSGRFFPAYDQDEYRFEGKKGETVSIRVIAQQLDQRVDPFLMLQSVTTNEEGVETFQDLSVIDDSAQRDQQIGKELDASTDDPSISIQLPHDGIYRILIRDLASTFSRPSDHYLIELTHPQPDFNLVVMPVVHRRDNDNQIRLSSLTLRPGSAQELLVRLERVNGFDGEVKVELLDLPEGVSCPPLLLQASETNGRLIVSANENASVSFSSINVQATTTLNGEHVSRAVPIGNVSFATENRSSIPSDSEIIDELGVSVPPAELALLTVDFGSEIVTQSNDEEGGLVVRASRGAKLQLPIELVRRQGFSGPVVIKSQVQGGIQAPEVTVAENQVAGHLQLLVSDARIQAGRYRLQAHAEYQFSYARNQELVAELQQRLQKLDQERESLKQQKTEAPENAEVIDQRMQKLESLRPEVEQLLQRVTNENKPRDVREQQPLPNLWIDVRPAPWKLTATTSDRILSGEIVDLKVAVERQFEFAGEVTIQIADHPEKFTLDSTNTKLNTDQKELVLKLRVPQEIVAGTHRIPFTASAKFNDVDVSEAFLVPLTVVVEK